MGGFNLQEMLAQARQQAEKLQEKMQQVVIEASSGGGSVTVKMTGQKQLLSVVIEPEVVKSGDIEMLQDLVTAAVNQASQKVDEALKPVWAACSAAWVCRGCEFFHHRGHRASFWPQVFTNNDAFTKKEKGRLLSFVFLFSRCPLCLCGEKLIRDSYVTEAG